MDSEDLNCDILFKEIANPQIKKEPLKKVSKPKLEAKVEFQTLQLSEKSQKKIWDTLKHIYGEDFLLDDESKYISKKTDLSAAYWMNRGNLVVKGTYNYSQNNANRNFESENLRNFAVNKLESYGFHTNHCQEALDYCNDNVDEALILLYNKYFELEKDLTKCDHGLTESELIEQRIDEKSVLESIYDNCFVEKEKNKFWTVKFKLNYLIEYFLKDNPNPKNFNANKLQNLDKLCKNFLKGHCKYGERCRFIHEFKPNIKENQIDPNNDYYFELIIRFPDGNMYPYELPIILLESNSRVEKSKLLLLCKRLIDEAKVYKDDGIVCIYSICELLKNEDEIKNFLNNSSSFHFLSPNHKLFQTITDKSIKKFDKLLPSHYSKGVIYNENRKNFTLDELISDDKKIQRVFMNKTKEERFNKILAHRSKLPAWDMQEVILNTLKNNQVVVISGETGCGKSTQVPQFLLDDWLLNLNEHIEIVCTQPRRISAIGLAERVSDERLDKVGNLVGYQIRLENKISAGTRLTFCTYGILLRKLQVDPNLTYFKYVIVDEVHERSEESDFLLLILKRLLNKRPDLKLILMSATLNAKLFSDYFNGCPVIEIPGRTHPVKSFYLEDILEMTDYILEEGSEYSRFKKISKDLETELASADVQLAPEPRASVKDENLTYPQIISRYQGYSRKTLKNLYLMEHEKINYELIEATLTWMAFGDHDYPKQGSILIFLPGIGEITCLYDRLSQIKEFSKRENRFLILPLHSSLTNEEQSAIFKKPPKGVRKIIISTNIAETSITIDDCVFVIDSGKMKEKRFDSNKNMESLEMAWVSRAQANQRKGRAGRVMSGICVHLYTSNRYKYQFLSQPVPEIQRVPLEGLLLKIRVMPDFDQNTFFDVLGETVEAPTKENISSAISRLMDVGALDEEYNLTPLGCHLAQLPVDVRIGKLMLFGAIFCCLDSALTIAASLNYKSPFVSPFNKKSEADQKKKSFAVANSDQITTLRAYKKWLEHLKRSSLSARVFASENFLSERTMTTIMDIKYQFLELLIGNGFVPIDLKISRRTGQDQILSLTGDQINSNGENHNILSAILCAALYPNVVKVLTPEKTFLKSAAGAVPKVPVPEDLKFKTKQDGYVHIHPSSVNSQTSYFSSPYLVYQEKIKTSKLFVKDTCMVPILPLILFSGCNLKIERYSEMSCLSLEDGWIKFRTETHEVGEMIKVIREELIKLLEEKIKDPLLNLLNHENGNKIISTIVYIITNN